MNCKKIVCKTFYLIVLSVFIFSGTAYSLRPPLVSDTDLIAAYNKRQLAATSIPTANLEKSERLIIEKAREDDLMELLEFRDKYFKGEIVGYNEKFDVELYRIKLAEIIRGRDPGAVIVARSHGNIIGYAVSKLLTNSISIGEIAEIVVHPDYQNRGVGKELF